MERGSCKDFRQKGGDWQNDGSFFTVFHEFVSKNVSMPSDLGELIAYVWLLVISWYALLFALRFLIAYVLLLVISWYTLIFAFRFLISLVKPDIVVVAAFFVVQFLPTYEFVGLVDLILAKIMDIIAHALV